MIDLTEIKKLPDEEKWKIIEEIQESMKSDILKEETPDADYKEKLHQLLEERLEAYNKGESKSHTWKEVKNRLQGIKEKMHPLPNG